MNLRLCGSFFVNEPTPHLDRVETILRDGLDSVERERAIADDTKLSFEAAGARALAFGPKRMRT